MTNNVKNDAGVFNARRGRYTATLCDGLFSTVKKTVEVIFTHRDPKSGKVWSDDIPVNWRESGAWVDPEKVEWL